MNPAAAAKAPGYHLRPLNLHRPSLSKPPTSFSLRFPSPPLPQFSLLPTIRASVPNPNSNCRNSLQEAAPEKSSNPFLAPLKTAMGTAVAAAALLFSGFYLSCKPSIASPVSPSENLETSEWDSVADEEREKSVEEHLVSNPDDVDALKNLMEIKMKSKKTPEAIEVIDKLIELEPEEVEWPMTKAHLHAYDGAFQLAKNGYYELVNKDPLCVEAYHGLVTVASQEEPSQQLEIVERRIEEAIKLCEGGNKERDLRLLLAQIRVLEGKYDDALRFYEELLEEDPTDFRPHLCRGIIYTLMGKTGEADDCFQKYTTYVDQNMMMATNAKN